MAKRWVDRLSKPKQTQRSWLRSVMSGGVFRSFNTNAQSSLVDIKTQIDTMRALAQDSQISTALSYYATDATTMNSSGQIIWASATDKQHADVANVINDLFTRWNVNAYARDHILELATIGNLYIPTTEMYRERVHERRSGVALDNNTIPNDSYDIIPSTKIPPEDVIHLWQYGKPHGFLYKPEDRTSECIRFPETSVIHFSLGGLIGDYTMAVRNSDGEDVEYDIQFATPLMAQATQPTQTLNLLEDALLLSSFLRVVKFVNVDCGNSEEEDEVRASLQQIKDAIEQQLSINTATGDTQSFVNPQSPNNLIYVPKVNGQDAISITDLDMTTTSEQDTKLLEYYQDKKLSVLGVPKEALNFSSSEGLGGAGNVMSQRSAIYANALQRIENAYMSGWRDALNKYFQARNMNGFVDKFTLHMNPIVTQLSTIQFEKRDAALQQASSLVELMKSLSVEDRKRYAESLQEVLVEVFPKLGSDVLKWDIDTSTDEEGGMSDFE